MSEGKWLHRKFHRKQWKRVNDPAARRYRVNAYRVLPTRARQGMAILVPPGDEHDPTRLPVFHDGTSDYLTSLGIERI
ncbi:MAG: DUF2075 domain-containing protein [Planctomycetes bacterium]|nr:DUF2075 domain-containing protein [Planctomycetota bacterium]